jgi:hypothetical protein
MERFDILAKGGKVPVGTVRNWGGTEYVKVAPGDWRRVGMGKKEKWDSSDEKARELTVAMFGTPEEVREMAKPVRTARNENEAKLLLVGIQQKGPLENKHDPRIKALVSTRSIKKILNNKAKNQSFNLKAHLQAAVNVDKFLYNSIEPWKFELNPQKDNNQVNDRRFFYAPMGFEGRIVPVKLTLMEYQNGDINLYSVEAIDVVLE